MPGKIGTITVEGFLSIRSATVELGDFNLLIGANGSGKSNFVSALELLGRIVDEDLGLYVGRRGGASALLHRGVEPSDEILLDLEAEPNGYRARLVPAAADELVFADEQFSYHDADRYDTPWIKSTGRGHRETRLLEVVEERGQASAAGHVINMLRGCRVFHFDDTSIDAPVKRLADGADNRRLGVDAGNLAPFLRRIADEHPAHYERIRSAVHQVAPFFRDFVLEEEKGRMRLRWRQLNLDGTSVPTRCPTAPCVSSASRPSCCSRRRRRWSSSTSPSWACTRTRSSCSRTC